MPRCEKHGYDYQKFCWFCYCEYIGKPSDRTEPGEYNPKLMDAFIKKHPSGKIGGEKKNSNEYWKQKYDKLLDYLKGVWGAGYVLDILRTLEEEEEKK